MKINVKTTHRIAGVLITLFAIALHAQTFEPLPYMYSFEASENSEQAKWVLNPGTNLLMDSIDRWTIGSAIANDGEQSLYISVDNGAHADAIAQNNPSIIQFVYRDFVLPAGIYYLNFDWICPSASLYVGFSSYVDPDAAAQQLQQLTEYLGVEQLPVYTVPSLNALCSDKWENTSLQFQVKQPSNGQTRKTRLWFAWINNQQNMDQMHVSASIDKLEILQSFCNVPTNLSVEVVDCESVNFKWEGEPYGYYQVQYRETKHNELTWNNQYVIDANGCQLQPGTGLFDLRVRKMSIGDDPITGLLDTTYSPYAYLYNYHHTVFCSYGCIEYANIYDTTWAACSYGTPLWRYHVSTDAPFQNSGIVDFGWTSQQSRHTVVCDTTSLDERTNNNLRMVPSGANASVRLGNCTPEAKAEAITYKYTVEDSNALLVLNFAYVICGLADGDAFSPQLVIRLNDSIGNLLAVPGAFIRYNADSVAGRGWHIVEERNAEDASTYRGIAYKDWASIPYDLSDYTGQTIYLTLENYGGFGEYTKDYGYAYVTLDCGSAQLEYSTDCETGQTTLLAPKGYNYKWFAGIDTTVLSTERTISVVPDGFTLRCVLSSPELDSILKELYFWNILRQPKAEFTVDSILTDTAFIYRFTNTSHIIGTFNNTIYNVDDDKYTEYEWLFDFGNGESYITNEYQPKDIVYPKEGGEFSVRLTAMYGDNCVDEKTLVLTVSPQDDNDAINPVRQSGNSAVRKMIHDGYMLIQQNDKTYTLTGAQAQHTRGNF